MKTFGTLGGRAVHEVAITAPDNSIDAKIIEYGAVVRDMTVARGKAPRQRVVLGLETLEDYIAHSPHMGAIAGRYANRIRGGKFALEGKTFQLPCNQYGKHSLHGGGNGLGKRPWTILHHDASSVTLAVVSPDGEHGYPGALTVTCRYAAVSGGRLAIDLTATTSAPTVVNLCHHSYFNLDGGADILDHTLEVRANLITPVDADLIPNGSMQPVAGTAFDFRNPRAIRLSGPDGARVWYDHNFILRRDHIDPGQSNLARAATLASAKSKLAMDVWTTEPALQVYDGFKVDVPVAGLGRARYGANAGICLEPQHCPDSPNLPHFPSTVLNRADVYRQTTVYAFRDA